MVVGAKSPLRVEQRFKRFPPGRAGVLIPDDSKSAAALGLCLYTASRPTVLLAQKLTFSLMRRLGTHVLPGPSRPWTSNIEHWECLLRTWQKDIGPFDSLALYQRKQASRSGLTILLVRDDVAVAVVKVRDDPDAIGVEQRALDAIRRAQVRTFHSPEPLGTGRLDNGIVWSAQTAVFDAPHRPVFKASPSMFGEISAALASVVETTPTRPAAHNDLTPWNLRVDRADRVWLFDWEDVGPAPVDADRCYFSAASYALHRTVMPKDLTLEAVEHWIPIVSSRRRSGHDPRLGDALLEALDIARSSRSAQEVGIDSSR